jgi:hypothetical protein
LCGATSTNLTRCRGVLGLGRIAGRCRPRDDSKLGTRACHAIENAIVLAACLKKHQWVEPALVEYGRRIPRPKQLVLGSRQLGIIAQFENPIMPWVRDTVMPIAPKEIAERRPKSLLEVEILSSIERSLPG